MVLAGEEKKEEYTKKLTKGKGVTVTANHNKESRQEPGNNQTISLTSVVCKTMERLVNKGSLITHLEMNKLIGDSQHGFRNKCSCLTSLLDFFSKVIDIYDTDNTKAVGRSCPSGLSKSI